MTECIVERWLPVVGYEGIYSVSDLGRVRSEPRRYLNARGRTTEVKGRILKTCFLKAGYENIDLRKDNTAVTHYVHRLVLTAFVGEAPAKYEACHFDGNRKNNALYNLRWDTRANNHADKLRHGTDLRGEKSPNAKLTADQVRSIRSDPAKPEELGRQYGVTAYHIYHLKSGRAWPHVA